MSFSSKRETNILSENFNLIVVSNLWIELCAVISFYLFIVIICNITFGILDKGDQWWRIHEKWIQWRTFELVSSAKM